MSGRPPPDRAPTRPDGVGRVVPVGVNRSLVPVTDSNLPGVKQHGSRVAAGLVAGGVTFAFGVSGAGDDTSNSGAVAVVALIVGLVVFSATKPKAESKK